MKALCPSCGVYHEVIRSLEDGFGDDRTMVYEIAPLETCTRSWLSQKDLTEAAARFDQDTLIDDADGD